MIRIGIIGLGWWGKQIVTCLAESPRFKVVAGCDIDTRMAAPFTAAQKLDLVDDYRSLIRRADLDAVAVVTPHLLHEEMAIAALEAGKQVFCEKPLALTAASAERILAASEKAGGVLGIGHERRYEPAMEEMRRLFDDGALGRVLHMDANVSHNNFRKMDPTNWRRNARHAPAGAWTALGIHLGDMFVSLAGKPVRVAARTASQVFTAPSEDFVSAEIDFENGARGRITCLSTPPFYGRFTLVCDRGWVETQEGGNVDKGIPSSFVYCGPDGCSAHAKLRAREYCAHEFRGLGRCARRPRALSIYERAIARQYPHSRCSNPLSGGGWKAYRALTAKCRWCSNFVRI